MYISIEISTPDIFSLGLIGITCQMLHLSYVSGYFNKNLDKDLNKDLNKEEKKPNYIQNEYVCIGLSASL